MKAFLFIYLMIGIAMSLYCLIKARSEITERTNSINYMFGIFLGLLLIDFVWPALLIIGFVKAAIDDQKERKENEES